MTQAATLLPAPPNARAAALHAFSQALARVALQALSEQMAAFMGAPEARRNEVVKRLWEHIKANSLNVRPRACNCAAQRS